MKFYLISGEASGDLHGSALINSIKGMHSDALFRAWGGDKMKAAGAQIVKHYKDLAFMGFIEVAKNIRTILSNFALCKKDIRKFQPDAIILIDYPGFNLRIAKWAHQQGYRIIYYISPQLWAWHSSRVKQIAAYVDEMITILPFEKAFYSLYDIDVHYVGHPLYERVADFKALNKASSPVENSKPILLLMPGSREQEIRKMLPIFLKAAKELNEYEIIVSGVSTVHPDLYDYIPTEASIVMDKAYDLLNKAHIAWVSSGTATLEAGLFKVPQIVCYQGNPISFRIAKRLINVPYISLVNLISEQDLVTELIQEELNVKNLIVETAKLELDYGSILERYETELISKLSQNRASDKAAQIILNSLKRD